MLTCEPTLDGIRVEARSLRPDGARNLTPGEFASGVGVTTGVADASFDGGFSRVSRGMTLSLLAPDWGEVWVSAPDGSRTERSGNRPWVVSICAVPGEWAYRIAHAADTYSGAVLWILEWPSG